jgi:hypothetical protein
LRCAPFRWTAAARATDVRFPQALEFCTDQLWPGLFVRDNARALELEMDRVMGVVRFLDPELHNHLGALQVSPLHFAVPWLLTAFAHVLPMDDARALWDALLLQALPWPAMFAATVLVQLRRVLLALADFGDAVSFLTRLPVSASELVDCGVKLALDAMHLFPFLPGMDVQHQRVRFYLTDDLLANALVVDLRPREVFLGQRAIKGAVHFELDSAMLGRDASGIVRTMLRERDAKGCRVLGLFGGADAHNAMVGAVYEALVAACVPFVCEVLV